MSGQGRGIAYLTMVLMLGLSIASNIAHTFDINADPSSRQIITALAWPVMVWLGVEMFVRVPWRDVLAHRLVRWVGILLVAFIAALVSYRHMRGLMIADGEEWTVYTFGPLAVDGLMLMSTLALLLTRKLPEVEPLAELEREQIAIPLSTDGMVTGDRPAAEALFEILEGAPPEAEIVVNKPPRERRPRPVAADKQEAIRLLLTGMDVAEVAQKFGMGESTVRKYMTAIRVQRTDPEMVQNPVPGIPAELMAVVREGVRRERVR